MRGLIHGAVGAAFALALVFACSDDSPSGADAATPNCEPSLDGRIVTLENVQSGSDGIAAIAICPGGSTRLGGGCEIDAQGGSQSLHLRQAGARSDQPGNYACEWDNPDHFQATGKAWVTCLLPAP